MDDMDGQVNTVEALTRSKRQGLHQRHSMSGPVRWTAVSIYQFWAPANVSERDLPNCTPFPIKCIYHLHCLDIGALWKVIGSRGHADTVKASVFPFLRLVSDGGWGERKVDRTVPRLSQNFYKQGH